MAGVIERGGPHRLSRTAVTLLLLLAWRAHTMPQARADEPAGFDQALAARVFTAAFTFMAPRTLEPVPLPRMTLWGLQGITALDPSLVPVLHESDVTLAGPGHVLAVLKLPAADDVAGWGELAASLSASAFHASDALQRAGTQGLITSFFDEVFNHLDPYSRYVPPGRAAIERDYRRGAAGIGVTLGGRAGGLLIASVVAESPADGAGLRPGERLLAIDGHPLRREDEAAAMARLAGDEGTTVVVTVRARDGVSRSVTMQRVLVPADTVSAGRVGDLLMLQVSGFTASTASRLQHELDLGMAHKPEPAGVVFDLRGNRGGVLHQAVDVANLVLERGLIGTTEGRDPAANHQWFASAGDEVDGLPIVVLVDGRSASAAEVLAAALSDDGRAVVVGSVTLGKGLVQTVGPMPDGGELFVTWSRVLAPAGWPLQGLGVMPQVCTSMGQVATQSQLDALNQGRQTMKDILSTHRRARPNLPLAEMLAIRNACPAALGTDSDLDAAKFLIDNPVAYASALAPN